MSLMPSSPQEHPKRLPGAGGCVGAEPRAAAQVHHAGHRHHAQAGEALSLGTPPPHMADAGFPLLGSHISAFQGPRVEILAKNLRVKDQMPQGAPR